MSEEIDPGLRIDGVTLAVADLARSVDFYSRVLGLPLLALDADGARLGLEEGAPSLSLVALKSPTPLPPRASGLFHVAWLHPSREALASSILRVLQAGWRFTGASDHGVSEALYLNDPDGLGIELYADRPRGQWARGDGGEGVVMVTEPLDVEDLLALSAEPTEAFAPGTGVGHVHLKVADVDRAASFYDGALGMREQARVPGASFLGAGGYHHHVAVNSWQSPGAPPAPESAPGLRLVRFALPSHGAVDELAERLAARDLAMVEQTADDGERGVRVLDPDSVPLEFVPSD